MVARRKLAKDNRARARKLKTQIPARARIHERVATFCALTLPDDCWTLTKIAARHTYGYKERWHQLGEEESTFSRHPSTRGIIPRLARKLCVSGLNPVWKALRSTIFMSYSSNFDPRNKRHIKFIALVKRSRTKNRSDTFNYLYYWRYIAPVSFFYATCRISLHATSIKYVFLI